MKEKTQDAVSQKTEAALKVSVTSEVLHIP